MLTKYKMRILNKEASSSKNKPDEIIEHLNIKEGITVGDIGCGGGFFTYEFSKRVGDEGIVYAIDVDRKSLELLTDSLKNEGNKNVKTIIATQDGIDLPEESVDLFFLRNVFHHLQEPVEYFEHLKKSLKEDGKIAIIDHKNRKLSFTGLFGHYTPLNVLLDIMDRAGFHPQENYDFLEDQLFIMFHKKLIKLDSLN